MSQHIIGVIGEGPVVLEIIEQGLELGHIVKALSDSAKILNSNTSLLVCENKLGSAYLSDALSECTAVVLSLAGKRNLNPDAISGLKKLFEASNIPWYILLDRFEESPHFFMDPEPQYIQQDKHFDFAESLHTSPSTSTVVVVPNLFKDDPCFSHAVVHEAQVTEKDQLCIPNLAYFLLKDIEANVMTPDEMILASRKELKERENLTLRDRSRWFGLKQPSPAA